MSAFVLRWGRGKSVARPLFRHCLIELPGKGLVVDAQLDVLTGFIDFELDLQIAVFPAVNGLGTGVGRRDFGRAVIGAEMFFQIVGWFGERNLM